MSVAKHIPNFITLCNLFCGCMSVVYASEGNFVWSAYFIFIATIFDFGDGLAARALKVQSEVGKQLDSLADMVTFGFAPGFLVFSLLFWFERDLANADFNTGFILLSRSPLSYLPFCIPVFSALRLAKFNVDENQSTEFIGLATPANALFFGGLVLALFSYYESLSASIADQLVSWEDVHPIERTERIYYYFLGLSVAMSLVLVAPIRMFSFKFKNMSWSGNEVRYIFIGIALLAIVGGLLIKNVFASVPIIILLYLITSMVNNLFRKDK